MQFAVLKQPFLFLALTRSLGLHCISRSYPCLPAHAINRGALTLPILAVDVGQRSSSAAGSQRGRGSAGGRT